MRRCVVSRIRALAVIKPGIEVLLNSATANDGSRMSNDKSASMATRALDWGVYGSRVLVVTSRDDERFYLSRYSSEVRAVETTAPAPGTGALPRRSRSVTARCGRSAYRYENRCDRANETRDYLAWWSVLWHLFHPSQSRPMNCSERS
jgi:hypothetical protein